MEMTPAEFEACRRAAQQTAAAAYKDDIALAWHIAAFSRQKRLKSLTQILGALNRKRKPKSKADYDNERKYFQDLENSENRMRKNNG